MTVPAAPPAAGPDRALDPEPPAPGPPEELLPVTGVVAVPEGDRASATDSPTTAHSSAAATIHPTRLFDRHGVGFRCRRACSSPVTEAVGTGERGGGGGGPSGTPGPSA